MFKKSISIFLILFLAMPVLTSASTSTTALCDKLVEYYVDTWNQHQQLSREIQAGGLWPPEANEARMDLFLQLDKYLRDTARQLERHDCVIPDDAIEL